MSGFHVHCNKVLNFDDKKTNLLFSPGSELEFIAIRGSTVFLSAGTIGFQAGQFFALQDYSAY